MAELADLWPLYRLRLRLGDLELRLPDEPDLAALAELAGGRIHDPEVMPFSYPWTDASPAERRRGALQWHWKVRGEWSPDRWTLPLVAVQRNIVVGTQDLFGRRFVVTREVSTGSWVGAPYQRRGIGTSMRRAVLPGGADRARGLTGLRSGPGPEGRDRRGSAPPGRAHRRGRRQR